jgi:hypothetical protein
MTMGQLDLQRELLHFAATFRINSIEAVNQGLGLGLFVNQDRGRAEQSLRHLGFSNQSVTAPMKTDFPTSPRQKAVPYEEGKEFTKEALNLKLPAKGRKSLFGAMFLFSNIVLRKVCAFILDFLFLLSAITLSIRAIATLMAWRGVAVEPLIDSVDFSQHYLAISGAFGVVVLLYFLFFRVFLGKTVGGRVVESCFGTVAKKQG